ncbi:MAG: DHHA1 domain-containing protein [Desulfomicrobium escambiense]|nr:DHHA1 domain-containing protein [Desulfomicrobium escambiense]
MRDKLGQRRGGARRARQDGKAVLLVAVTKDLTGKVKAGDLVKEAAKLVGGSGGGKPDLAQAGGADPAGLGGARDGRDARRSRRSPDADAPARARGASACERPGCRQRGERM